MREDMFDINIQYTSEPNKIMYVCKTMISPDPRCRADGQVKRIISLINGSYKKLISHNSLFRIGFCTPIGEHT